LLERDVVTDVIPDPSRSITNTSFLPVTPGSRMAVMLAPSGEKDPQLHD
jgi:hypothetical protein